MGVMGVAEVVLKARWVGGYMSAKGRVPCELIAKTGESVKYSLELLKIGKVYFDGQHYYIVYRTSNADYYKSKYVTTPETLGIPCERKEYDVWFCRVCHSRIYWETDEPWCPRCGEPKGCYKRVKIIFRYEWYEVLKYCVEVVTNKKLEDIGHFWANAAGGVHIKDAVNARELGTIMCACEKVELMECKGFTVEESYWDWVGQIPEKKYTGHFIIATWYPRKKGGWERVVYRVVG